MWFGRDPESVRALEDEGHDAIGRGDLHAALAAAERLLAMGWSGGFEIKALALHRGGQIDGALATLEEGVKLAPQAWVLWQLLGNLRSDAGQLDAALEAFDAALVCPDASESTVRFNRAILQHRRGEPGAALDDIEPILALPRPPTFAEDALSLAARCLAELGRAEDGLTLVTSALAACADDDARRPRLEAERALALDRLGRDPTEALEAALHHGVVTPELLAMLRRVRPPAADAPKRYRLVLQAEAKAAEATGMLRVFDLVAADEAQALELGRALFPRDARASVAVEEITVLEEPTALEPGVHGASGLILFDG